MSYATQQAMEETFGAQVLVQLTGRGSALDSAVLERALADAERLIDSYLAERYSLPLTGRRFPTRTACDVAMYYLLGTKVNESAQTRYDQALAFLRDIARGLATLPLDGGSGETADDKLDEDLAQAVAGERVFSADTLRDY